MTKGQVAEGSERRGVAEGAMTHTALRTGAVAALAFAAGLGAARLAEPARAAPAPLQPAVIDLGAIAPDDLPKPTTASPNLRSKPLAVADGATAQVQIGTVAKHYHADANEIQYVVEGTGSEWLGDKQYPLKPGLLLVIPKGTPHGGTTEASGHLKILAVKTPPQDPADVHPVP
jgi:mannose-6-phosphate isomerase-like protein (cupin superfamily)